MAKRKRKGFTRQRRERIVSLLDRHQRGRCARCHRLMQYHDASRDSYATIDHVVPHSQGGSDHVSNLQLMHKRCNGAKGDQV